MNRITQKSARRSRRKKGLRKRAFGVPSKPRLTVFRSLQHTYAQVIDDLTGKTIVSASTIDKGARQVNGGNCEAAKAVGASIAERAKAAGIDRVVFDRSGFAYHGRVKAVAEAARQAGLRI